MDPNFRTYLKCTDSGVTPSQKNMGCLTIPKINAQPHGHLVKALSWNPGDRYSSATSGKSNLPGSGSHLQNGSRSLIGSTLFTIFKLSKQSSVLRCFLQNFSQMHASIICQTANSYRKDCKQICVYKMTREQSLSMLELMQSLPLVSICIHGAAWPWVLWRARGILLSWD